jgi:DNA polymerase V
MSSNSVTISQPVFALVDVNNFYVSCERAFNPNLINRPVVVLSNNNGCAVARSMRPKHSVSKWARHGSSSKI